MSNQRKTTHNQNTDDGFSQRQRFYLTLGVIFTTIVLYAGYATLAGTNIATTLNLFGSGTTLNDGLVGHWTFDGEDISGQPSDDQSQWYDADWLYRVPITIQSSQVSANLTDFPVYVDLADLPAHFFSNVRSDGGDIRVTKSNGTTEVAREVVDIDTGGDTGEIHFNVDGTLSSSTDTTFYLYYGNASGTDYAIDATYGAENVWTNDYVMVHHFEEGDSTATDFYLDSTANLLHGTLDDASGNSSEDTNAPLGSGFDFFGDGDTIDIDNFTAPTTGNVSLWFHRDSVGVVARLLGIEDSYEYRIDGVDTVEYTFFDAGGAFVSSTIDVDTAGQWYHLSTNYSSGSTMAGYIDGSAAGSGGNPGDTVSGTTLSVGSRYVSANFHLDGSVDELRISSTTRSADWISAEYVNQSTTTDFYSVGTNESNFLSSGRTALDRSENENNGTLVNMDTSGVTSGAIGQALLFDGINDTPTSSAEYVEIPRDASLEPSDAITVSAWVKVEDFSDSVTQKIVAKPYTSDTDPYQSYSLTEGNSLGGDPDQIRFEVNINGSLRSASGASIPEGEWIHLVGTWNNGEKIKLYVDSVLKKESAAIYSGTITYYDTPLIIGSSITQYDQEMSGAIDDVRIYNRQLTPDEIKQLYRQGATTKIAKTPELAGPTTSIDDGLIGHWTLDSKDMDLFATTDQIIDRSSAGNDGDLIGMGSGTTTDRGVLGQSLLFADGTFIDIGSALPTSAYTKTAWIKMNGLGNGNNNIMSGGAADGHAFWVPSCKSYVLSSGHSGSSCAVGQWDDVQDSEALQFDQWYFVAVSYDSAESSGTMRLYRDGVEIDSATSISAPSSGTAYIATYGSGSALTFNGNLDDVRLYNRALTSDEIKQIYRQGATTKIATTPSPSGPTVTLDDGLVGHWTFDGPDMDVFASDDQVTDVSGNGQDGVIVNMGSGTTTVRGALGQSLEFDGASNGSHVFVNGNGTLIPSGATEVSAAAWFKPRTLPGSGIRLLGQNGPLQLTIAGGKVGGDFLIHTDTDGWDGVTGATPYKLNEWNHAAVTYDGAAIRVYLNGELDGTDLSHTGGLSIDLTCIYIGISSQSGCVLNSSNSFAGAIDDVRIYDRTLSADEIRQLYRMGM